MISKALSTLATLLAHAHICSAGEERLTSHDVQPQGSLRELVGKTGNTLKESNSAREYVLSIKWRGGVIASSEIPYEMG